MVFLAFEGIRSSLRTALVLFTRRGRDRRCCWRSSSSARAAHDGLTLHPLTPAASPHGFSGLTTGFVFAALSFVGFEAAATLGDEVREPRRIVPRAILLVACSPSACSTSSASGPRSIGLGADDDQRARRQRRRRGTTSPRTYASWMKWPVIIASVSSMFAVMINSSNGIVRILNTMGREGLLPRPFAFIDPQAPHAVVRRLRHRRLRGRARARSSARSAAASATRRRLATSTATSASCSRSASSRSTC